MTGEPSDISDATPSTAGEKGMLNRHRRLAMILAVLAIVGAGTWLTYFYWPAPDNSPPVFNWYTVDDGASWFQDDAERIPPFGHDGKPAVRLHLFSCDGGKTTFVGYLQKLPEEVLKKYRDKGIDPATVDDDELAAETGWLVKLPGKSDWVSSKGGEPAYLAIVNVKCPDGHSGSPDEVFPKNPKKR
jgi:hypothetical protein